MTEFSIISPKSKHTATLIFLHGLGDVGMSWYEAFIDSRITKNASHVKFIFPTAPIRKVTLNMGMSMTSWFDVISLDNNDREDSEGIEKSSKFLKDLIEEEIRNGISPDRILIGGFSMGGAVALHAAMTFTHCLAGVLALSTWLPLANSFPKELVAIEKKLNMPFLQCHGEQDSMIPLKWARLTEQTIKTFGFRQFCFREYKRLDHATSDREIKDVCSFIVQHLPK